MACRRFKAICEPRVNSRRFDERGEKGNQRLAVDVCIVADVRAVMVDVVCF